VRRTLCAVHQTYEINAKWDPPASANAGSSNQAIDGAIKRRRLLKEQVKYIVFEGGGGKGFACLGALRALKLLNVLQYINPKSSDVPTADGKKHSRLDFRVTRSVGGSSAGAITAFLLSIGYTPGELEALMLALV
jgi:predicted acylesterase/phospholipase RssA